MWRSYSFLPMERFFMGRRGRGLGGTRKWGIWESFGSTQNGVKSTPRNTRRPQKTRKPGRLVLNVPLEKEHWAAMRRSRLFWPRTARVARPQQIWWMWAKERKRATTQGNK